jgi:hypothetical protein
VSSRQELAVQLSDVALDSTHVRRKIRAEDEELQRCAAMSGMRGSTARARGRASGKPTPLTTIAAS